MFDQALEAVLRWEGGYSDHPADPGSHTNHGITIATLEMYRGKPLTPQDIKDLTLEEAVKIYRLRYWNLCRCEDMLPGIALLVFDSSVNQGPSRAARLLQKALKVQADGKIGPVTVKAANEADMEKLIDEFTALRAVYYAKLNATFHLGWYRRLVDMHRRALKI